MRVFPETSAVTRSYEAGEPQVMWTRLVSDLDTPVSAFLKLASDDAYAFLLESVTGGSIRGRFSVIGLRPDLLWRCNGPVASVNRQFHRQPDAFTRLDAPPLEALSHLLAENRIDLPAELPPMAAGLFGYLGYDMVRLMERLPDDNPDKLGLDDALLIRPTVVAVFDGILNVVTVVTPLWPDPAVSAADAVDQARDRLVAAVTALEGPVPAPHETGQEAAPLPPPVSNLTQRQYHGIVDRAKDYIRAGDVFQVVPSQRFSAPFRLPPFALYRALRRINPSPFLFFLKFDTLSLVGSSPEILVRLRDDVVTIRPIAGTRPRGKTAAEDKALAADLLADPKELAEHLMLLDLGRNDVGRVSQVGTVKVTERFTIEHYSHVMHIVSNVEGQLAGGLTAIDALVAGFPAGTVTGAPKIRAMEIIDELETVRRGVYGGCIGYFAANGTMDTCIALRTAVLKDGMMHVQAGGGVVADSDPEAEYQETVNKAKALFKAAEEAVRFAQGTR